MALTGADRGTGNHNTGATSVACTTTSNCTAGALVVLKLSYDNAGSGGSDPYSSVSDSSGNTWTSRQGALYDPGAASAGACHRIFTCPQDVATITTGTTVTVSFGSTSVTAKSWAFEEFTAASGFVVTYVTGGVGTGAGTGTPSVTTGTITTGDAVSCGGAAESADTWAGDADTTNGNWSTHQHNAAGTGTTGMSITSQRKIVTATATQTYNPTLTSADCILAWVQLTESIIPIDPMGQLGIFGI